MGIKLDLIKEISESDLPYITEESQPTKTEKAKPVPKLPDSPEKNYFLQEKEFITEKIEAVSSAFRDAKAKNNKKKIEMERKKLLLLKTELSELRKKVMADNDGQMPSWWNASPERP